MALHATPFDAGHGRRLLFAVVIISAPCLMRAMLLRAAAMLAADDAYTLPMPRRRLRALIRRLYATRFR